MLGKVVKNHVLYSGDFHKQRFRSRMVTKVVKKILG